MFGRIGRLGATRRGATAPWSIDDVPDLLLWLEADDLSTLFQDDAGATPVDTAAQTVGQWRDKSGAGNHLVQATSGSRPAYDTDGTYHWVQGDGTDDWLRVAFASGVAQPWWRVTAARSISHTSSDRIYGPSSGSLSGFLVQSAVSGSLHTYNGTSVPDGNGLAGMGVGEDHVVTEIVNGNDSVLAYDDGSPSVTSAGGPSGVLGVTMFASGTGTQVAAARIYAMAMGRGVPTEAQLARIREYLAAKGGISF